MLVPLGLLNTVLRYVEKPILSRIDDIPALRTQFRLQAKYLFSHVDGVTYSPVPLLCAERSIPALWVNPDAPARAGAILYFHGGGYVFGSPETHQSMLARLSLLTGLGAVLPQYRLAPESSFPAAFDDALGAYRCLLERGYRAKQIVIGGDSAGGGLALALLHKICESHLPQPGALFAFSPWTDLTLTGNSLSENAEADPYLPSERTVEMRDVYLSGADPKNPRASPLFGRFSGAPPVLLQVGESEILLDDSRRMAAALLSQGVDARLDVWPDLPHVWPMFHGYLKEADSALADVADFINTAVPKDG